MILARLSRAVREQNWFAVALEFIIVVAGVVIGFQINAWNEARAERVRESAYLDRLHAEIAELEVTREWRVTNRQQTHARLIEFAEMDPGRSSEVPDDRHCAAIGTSFIVSSPTENLAVLDELLSVGGLETILSGSVRAAIANYLLRTRRAQDANSYERAISIVLHIRFPELLGAAPVLLQNDVLGFQFECDFDGMRADPAFMNALATNGFSLSSHIRQNQRVNEALDQLHDAVDQALGRSAGDHDQPPQAAP